MIVLATIYEWNAGRPKHASIDPSQPDEYAGRVLAALDSLDHVDGIRNPRRYGARSPRAFSNMQSKSTIKN